MGKKDKKITPEQKLKYKQFAEKVNSIIIPNGIYWAEFIKDKYTCVLCESYECALCSYCTPKFIKSKCGAFIHDYCLNKFIDDLNYMAEEKDRKQICPACKNADCLPQNIVKYAQATSILYSECSRKKINFAPQYLLPKLLQNPNKIELIDPFRKVLEWLGLQKFSKYQNYSFSELERQKIYKFLLAKEENLDRIFDSTKSRRFLYTSFYAHFDNFCLLSQKFPELFEKLAQDQNLYTDVDLIGMLTTLLYQIDGNYEQILKKYNLSLIKKHSLQNQCIDLTRTIFQVFGSFLTWYFDENKQLVKIYAKTLWDIFTKTMEARYKNYIHHNQQELKEQDKVESGDKKIQTTVPIENKETQISFSENTQELNWISKRVANISPDESFSLNAWIKIPKMKQYTIGTILRIYGGSCVESKDKNILNGPYDQKSFTEIDNLLTNRGYAIAYLNLSDHLVNKVSQQQISFDLLNQMQQDVLEFIRNLKNDSFGLKIKTLANKVFVLGQEFGGLLATHLLANKNTQDPTRHIDGIIVWNGLLSLQKSETWVDKKYDKRLDPVSLKNDLSGNMLLIQSAYDHDVRPMVTADFVNQTKTNQNLHIYPYLTPSQNSDAASNIGPMKNYIKAKGQKVDELIFNFAQNPTELMSGAQIQRRSKMLTDYGRICIDPNGILGRKVSLHQYMLGMMRIFYEDNPQPNSYTNNSYYCSKILATAIKIREGVFENPVNDKIKKEVEQMFELQDIYNPVQFCSNQFQKQYLNEFSLLLIKSWKKPEAKTHPLDISLQELQKIIENRETDKIFTKRLAIESISKSIVYKNWNRLTGQQHGFIYQDCKPSAMDYHRFQEQAKKQKKKYGQW